MQKGELLRVVDSIHRDKEIDKEVLFSSIEQAMATAARKQYGKHSDVQVKIDRETGEISAACIHGDIPVAELGRIAAQIAKQVIIQKVREAERDVIHGEFEQKIGTIVSGSIQRFEKGSIIVNLGKTEGLIPRKEQVPSENFRPGDQIKGVLTEVRKNGQQNRIIISRTHPDFVRRLLENEIPEMHDKIIEIKAIARSAGYRTKVAISSIDPHIDCVGACVGVRGARVKALGNELGGDEKIDVIRWSDQPEILIANALKPAEVGQIDLDEGTKKAVVHVAEDQLSLAIGKRGQNVRLASELTGWEIELRCEEGSKDALVKAEAAKVFGVESFPEAPRAPKKTLDDIFSPIKKNDETETETK